MMTGVLQTNVQSLMEIGPSELGITFVLTMLSAAYYGVDVLDQPINQYFPNSVAEKIPDYFSISRTFLVVYGYLECSYTI